MAIQFPLAVELEVEMLLLALELLLFIVDLVGSHGLRGWYYSFFICLIFEAAFNWKYEIGTLYLYIIKDSGAAGITSISRFFFSSCPFIVSLGRMIVYLIFF